MTDETVTSRLDGGPCDGETVYTSSSCWVVIATRDSDRRPWFHHAVDAGEPAPVLAANEAHLYLRSPDGRFNYTPGGLVRSVQQGHLLWSPRHDEAGQHEF